MSAAERLFLQKGIGATSIDEIVSTAGVAKGTFYLYFDSKEDLLAAIQEKFVLAFRDLVQQVMDRHRPDQYRLRLRSWVKTAIDGYLDNVAVHDVIFHQFRPEDRKTMNDNAVIDQLVALVRSGIDAGEWAAEDPRMTTVMLFNAFHGAVDAEIAKGGPIDRPRLARTVSTFFERALKR